MYIDIALAVLAAFAAFMALRLSQKAAQLDEQLGACQSDRAEAMRKFQELTARYAPVHNVEAELAAVKQQRGAEIAKLEDTLRAARHAYEEFVKSADSERIKLSQEYEAAKRTFENMNHELLLLEENAEDLSFGLYKPHFSFESTEQYKAALEQVRDKERHMIREGKAAGCDIQWSVGGSAKDGARMVKQYSKLLLRAFNGECDAAIANVTWNNITKMEERVRKAFDAINELGGVTKVALSPTYRMFKIDELRLTHEQEQKRYEEREEQRKVREQIREEEKAEREFEKAKEDAEREEQLYNKALQRAREDAAKATGMQLQKLTSQIASLETKVDQARNNKERAIARAQLTKSGFVYVISNVGSFGERVFKIGMTRRMEPMDRIRELGDASVPFPFDLHVMLYSDNAPELEAALHKLVDDRRVNLVNPRKEFYSEVELDAIEGFVKQRGLSAQFIKIPEAKEYKETLAQRELRKKPHETPAAQEFPSALFEAASA